MASQLHAKEVDLSLDQPTLRPCGWKSRGSEQIARPNQNPNYRVGLHAKEVGLSLDQPTFRPCGCKSRGSERIARPNQKPNNRVGLESLELACFTRFF